MPGGDHPTLVRPANYGPYAMASNGHCRSIATIPATTSAGSPNRTDLLPVPPFFQAGAGMHCLAYASLEQAQHDPDGAIILSGDYGGTIFLTAPHLVPCSAEALVTLVSDLDAVTWMSGDPTIAAVAFEHHPIGTGVWGGDAGGVIVDRVWTHHGRLTPPVCGQAEEVVLGRRTRIDAARLRHERNTELARKRAWRMRQPPLPRNLPWDFDISPPAVPFLD